MDRKGQIIDLRRSGYTFREIGQLCGCSQQYAWYVARDIKVRRKPFRPVNERDCRYPNLREWMNDNGKSIGALSRDLYGYDDCGYPDRLRQKLTDKATILRKREIDAILAMTGMSYEEAFADG